ncbi:MAG: hypothetical protein LLG40_08985 [Deltaproteobacteria bacterium]|nr:hypothetical protein [Deltaproteobacteria bacterium]
MNQESALLILVVVLIVFVVLCIPVFLRIWRITKDVKMLLQNINQSLPSILKNIEEITTNVNSSSGLINKKIQDYASIPDRIMRNIAAVAKGMHVFAEVLLKKEKA